METEETLGKKHLHSPDQRTENAEIHNPIKVQKRLLPEQPLAQDKLQATAKLLRAESQRKAESIQPNQRRGFFQKSDDQPEIEKGNFQQPGKHRRLASPIKEQYFRL